MVMVVIDMMVMDIAITTAAPISMLRYSHQSMITSPHMYRYVLSPNILLESTLKSGGGGGGEFFIPSTVKCILLPCVIGLTRNAVDDVCTSMSVRAHFLSRLFAQCVLLAHMFQNRF